MDTSQVGGAVQAVSVGTIALYVLLRLEPRLERIERALERLARAQLLLLISRPGVDETVKVQARLLNGEIDDARKAQRRETD